jgi:hypothetical protein
VKIQLTKANAFQIDSAKKYVVMIVTDESLWTDEQKSKLHETLASVNMTEVFLPEGTKYKVVEAQGEK